MSFDNFDAVMTKVAGVGGALISLKFITGTWPERFVMAIGGSLLSIYGTPWAAAKTGLPEGLCGFLFGLFGMAICAKVWEAIQYTPIAELWQQVIDYIKRKLGD